MTPDERNDLIAQLKALPDAVEAVVAALPPDRLTATPIEGEWSVAQAVHHLADSHMQGFIRVKLMLTEDHPSFPAYSQPRFAQTADADNPDVRDTILLLRGLHARWARLFESLPDDAWSRTGVRAGAEPRTYTVAEILRTYAGHGEAHIEQIRRTLAQGESQ